MRRLFEGGTYLSNYCNWQLKSLSHLGQIVLTLRTLLHLGWFITFRPSTKEINVSLLLLQLQLEKLLEEVRNISLERQGELPSKCALFVCNKWDQVPGKEVNEVKNHVVRKLLRCWPGVEPESQIIHMSTTKASKAQGHGYITNEFSNLMNGLSLMVLKSIGSRLEIHWK